MLQDSFVQALNAHVRYLQVCPEVGIGLGVPRDPIRIVADKSGRRLVQPSTGRDLTASMRRFANDFLSGLGPVDGFVLKSRSPSCGIKDVKTFSEQGQPAEKSTGVFAEAVLNKFPAAAIEDEGRLTNFRLRHHFLTRLFAAARFREAQSKRRIGDLVKFHTEHKLQLMAYSPSGLKALGQILGNLEANPEECVWQLYAANLAQAMVEPARPSRNRNVLLHAFGYVSGRLSAGEKRHFLSLLEEYRAARLSLSVLLSLLQSWVVRFEEPYLATQRLFEPYPRLLLELSDSGAAARHQA